MRLIRFFVAAANVAALLTVAGPACAQANRTFVSGFGSDTNPCSLSEPCRSFAQALTQTIAGGEITVLDPAGYGTVTINKAISIVNDGVGEAGITVTTPTNAITVSVGASDVVNLRGLTVVGSGVGINGIEFNGQGVLNIQNCVIRGLTGQGIWLVPAGTVQFNVSDTIVSNNGVDANGIFVEAGGSGTVTGVFNRVQVVGSELAGFGIGGAQGSTGAINVTIANSTSSNNTFGIATASNAGQPNIEVMVVNSVVANNEVGIAEQGQNSTTYLAKNTITGNQTAFSAQGSGALFSFGDNDIKGNLDDGGAIPLVSTK